MTTAETTPEALIIDGALELLERDGWCSYGGYGPNGERCIATALNAAYTMCLNRRLLQFPDGYDRGAESGLLRLAYRQVERELAHRGNYASIPHWNDHHAYDFAEVREVLKLARDHEETDR